MVRTDKAKKSRGFGFVTMMHEKDTNNLAMSQPITILNQPVVVKLAECNQKEKKELDRAGPRAGQGVGAAGWGWRGEMDGSSR